ncbi:phosphoribosylglycinamide formyltransferase [Litchfieldia alkalitelluris]|uniref:phosphoribosylglycinamide formyltransferase n=1 Tax=Litchfieldia alkalitelluris TaxID=304268 RepID=UPI00099744C1|nr:phosphoribosylglycinamide formyltransferase [Litchfieldia alkalitelluris]
MIKLAVFASGSGSNFQAILDAVKAGMLDAEISLLVCDKPGAKVIERAAAAGINQFVFSAKDYASKSHFEAEIVGQLQARKIDLVVLAGYMRLVGDTLLSSFPSQIINIHPSLLPAFPGRDAIGQAFRAGVSVTGVTIHYVDEGMDTGPIIAQREVPVAAGDQLSDVERKIHEIEHLFYPEVLQKLARRLSLA